MENLRRIKLPSLHAYINPATTKINSSTHTSRDTGYVSQLYTAVVMLEGGTKIELNAFMDRARGFYISSNCTVDSDLKRCFIPQIITIATLFTFVEKLEEGVKREKGVYKIGEAQALVEPSGLCGNMTLQVTIESKNLGDMQILWDAIREGSILPHKLQVKTNKEPTVFAEEVLETVNELRKKLDWALGELARADRVIRHSNEMTAEWERLSREREELIQNLKAQIAVHELKFVHNSA